MEGSENSINEMKSTKRKSSLSLVEKMVAIDNDINKEIALDKFRM